MVDVRGDVLRQVVSFKLYGTGHALFKTELAATSKNCMLQGFSGGYTMYHDTSFMLYITKLYSVVWAIAHLNHAKKSLPL